MKTIIAVWPDGETWIVSKDRVEDAYTDGNNTGAISTTTLDVCDTNEDAIQVARQIAGDEMLPIYEQDQQGVPSIYLTRDAIRLEESDDRDHDDHSQDDQIFGPMEPCE
jgi:hypothetical protein